MVVVGQDCFQGSIFADKMIQSINAPSKPGLERLRPLIDLIEGMVAPLGTSWGPVFNTGRMHI